LGFVNPLGWPQAAADGMEKDGTFHGDKGIMADTSGFFTIPLESEALKICAWFGPSP
jgi:hypothetical protein